MTVRILRGDVRDRLRDLPDESVHCVVTSPPYYGLRDYGMDGQIGLEESPAAFLAVMVDVFREVRRVLRADGTAWVNMGDTYCAGTRTSYDHTSANKGNRATSGMSRVARKAPTTGVNAGTWERSEIDGGARIIAPGFKAKDLMGMPWRLALALQEDGWYLRCDIIWHKPNPMPESITDRPTKAHEYLFLLAKSERYYYDAKAIQEPLLSGPSDLKKMVEQEDRIGGKHKDLDDPLSKASAATNIGKKRSVGSKQAAMAALGGSGHRYASLAAADASEDGTLLGRNRRSVWTVATAPYSGAHFATFPPALIEPCILAGCPVGGTVLDPFGGAGTTGLVADRLQRDAILIEINPDYADMAEKRIRGDAPLFAQVGGE